MSIFNKISTHIDYMKASRTRGHQLSPTTSLSPTNSELHDPFRVAGAEDSSIYDNTGSYSNTTNSADDYLVPTRPRKNSFLTTLKHKLSMKRLPASTGQLHYDGTEAGHDLTTSPFTDSHMSSENTDKQFTEQWTQKSASIRKRSNTVSVAPVPPSIPENDILPGLGGHRRLQASKSALNLRRQWKSQEQDHHPEPVPPLPISGLNRIDNNSGLATPVSASPSTNTTTRTLCSNSSSSNTSSFTLNYNNEAKHDLSPVAAPQRVLTPEFDSRVSRDSFGAGSYYFGNDALLNKQPAPSRRMSFLKSFKSSGR
ncbi:hypothetical protein D0Z00_001595 [Geotrichum galactomycetum]|uniref:Uncharacterized protein n=1 Tax=Geotrichum galactomycetum TaxID=27317 RepID=A0ACB6V6K6_9ASCO|nr:hypothetical protein D0Z00_001595 [Geotrichum candidum]